MVSADVPGTPQAGEWAEVYWRGQDSGNLTFGYGQRFRGTVHPTRDPTGVQC